MLRTADRSISWLARVSLVVALTGGAFAIVLATALPSSGQLPVAKLSSINPVGAKVGSEVEVKINGGDLDDADQLLFSHPGITAAPKMEGPGDFSKKARPVPNTFTVRIAADVPPGLYEARAVGRFGMTNPRTFHVSSFDEISEESGNNSREKPMELAAGTIVNAQADGGAVDYYKIHATKGQRLLIDCWAQRIDSRMDATLALYDATGRELRRVRDTNRLDPVLQLDAPADGDYLLGVYDFTYGGGGEYFYRLAVHNGPYIDFVFPPVGQPGASGKFTLYGRNLPGGKPVENITVDGSPLEQAEANITLSGDPMSRQRLALASVVKPHESVVDSMMYQLKGPDGASNAVSIGYAAAPLVVEQEPNNDPAQPQQVSVPCDFAGQFYPREDRDWIQFEAKQGDVYWIDVLSHRLGLPTDPFIVVEHVSQNEQGEVSVSQVATMDDFAPPQRSNTPQMFSMNNRDPRYRFEAKSDGNYRVQVRDLYGDSRGDPRMVYRLIVRKEQPDFQVLAYGGISQDRNQYNVSGTALRRGEARTINVKVIRRDGFKGEVEISAEGLPGGVKCDGAVIGGGANSAKLVFQADANAPAWAGTIRIVGKAKIDGQGVVREARTGALIWGSKNVQQELPVARMTRDIGLSVIDKETAPASVQAGDGKLIETSIGGKVELPIKVARHGDFKSALKLKAAGLPKDASAKEVNVSGGDGKMEISLANNRIEPGTYTFYLTAPAKFKYSRNPDAVKQAEERQKELEQIVKELTDKAKQAAAKAKQARDAANKNKDDKGLAEAAQKAEEEAKQLDDQRKEAENHKKQADGQLNNAKNANKPKDINYNVISSPVSLRVDRTPIGISAAMPGDKKQGDKFEVTVNVERKYGFEDQIELSLEPPRGVGGVSAKKITIPKGQNQGKLEIALSDNATAGSHQFTLRGRVRYNNVQLDETQTVALSIAEKEKK